MRTNSTTYSNTTVKRFLLIDEGEYKEKIRFVNHHKEDLAELNLDEYALVMDAYGEALFEMGRYSAHIRVADELIELAIMHNVRFVGDKDLYFETLFQKAASLYNLERNDEALYILGELLKMDSVDESTRLFFINCMVRKQSEVLQTIRKISIVTILCSALVIAVELLYVRKYLPGAVDSVELTRNILFVSGTLMLIAGEVAVRYKAVSEMYKITRKDGR